MQLYREPEIFRRACDEARARGERVGLVPTMGALHEGHVALVEAAKARAGFVAVSIFVNPTQFGPNEDLARYPRTLEADVAACERAGADAVFAPSAEAMYAPFDETRVRVGATAAALDGVHRPGHFEGVATIVTKLFALTGPSVAIFGRKDYQQLRVIERLVADLFVPIEIVGMRTLREPDGVALSSRNRYLSAEDREKARAIPLGLSEAAHAFEKGERSADALRAIVRARVEPVALSVDYVEVADPITVQPLARGSMVGDRALVALALRIGGARLIDNLVLGEDAPPFAAQGGR